MNPPLRLFLSTLLALTIAFAYNFFFLNLFERPVTDQILLIAFSTAALGYLIFSFWGNAAAPVKPEITPATKKKFDGTSIQSFLRENIQGIVLALIFFAVYTTIGLKLNAPNRDTTDNFLDADNYSWACSVSPRRMDITLKCADLIHLRILSFVRLAGC